MGKIFQTNGRRSLLGLACGWSLWWFFEVWGDAPDRAFLIASVVALAVTAVLLVLVGRVTALRALGWAAGIASLVAALMLLSSFGFNSARDFAENGYAILWASLATLLPLPFLLGQAASGRSFDGLAAVTACYGTLLKAFAGLLFVGLFWLVLTIGNEVLGLAGIGILEWIFESGRAAMTLSGAAFGLALAFADEAPEARTVSFVTRVLRVFLPFALAVSLVFLMALPFRGLSELFGARSAATTLAGTAGCAILLITCFLVDARAAPRPLALCARVLCFLVPLLAGLGLYALWLRVDQYGWTPDRMAGVSLAGALALWGVLLALAARSGDWITRLERAAGQGGALVLLLAVLSLSPILDAGAISVRSQAARYVDGRVGAEDLPVREMMNDWGRSGPEALAALAALPDRSDTARLTQLVDWARKVADHWEPMPEDPAVGQEFATALARHATILPQGAVLPDWLPGALRHGTHHRFDGACDTAPNLPFGCFLIRADFRTDLPGYEVMVLVLEPAGTAGTARARHVVLAEAQENRPYADIEIVADPDTLRAELQAGRFELVPPGQRLLTIGGQVLDGRDTED